MKYTKKQWIKGSIAVILWILFTIWMESFWPLIVLPLIIDAYFTHKINWMWWKKSTNPVIRTVMEWIDAIGFALIAVYFINTFFFQNYQIPTSSLEKSLLVGDFLLVSKCNYGSRVPNTPLSFPLAQHTLPVIETKSYLDWPQWDYKRLKGFEKIERNDIVVFNFPAGDTVALKMQNPDIYTLYQIYGREQVHKNKQLFGEIVYRPVDRRENYVKRCVGMPGDSLSIINNQLYINGVMATNPQGLQYNYFVQTDGTRISEEQFRRLDISQDDRSYVTDPQTLLSLGFQPDDRSNFWVYHFPLTQASLEKLKQLSFIKKVTIEPAYSQEPIYPLAFTGKWSRDNYGTIWIPKKGETIKLTADNLPVYERCIRNYEANKLEVKGGEIFINDLPAKEYTFKMDYFWLMGDNRHNSADSRSWGFVPEDHVVGKPIFVWLSLDKDRGWFDGKIRFDRLFKMVYDI
ncbi:MAG: signal peptidase I [Bacteroidales bacterium]